VIFSNFSGLCKVCVTGSVVNKLQILMPSFSSVKRVMHDVYTIDCFHYTTELKH
jgi:hypothetical protein